MRLIRYLLAISLMVLPAFAQTITIRGQVTDESGGVVPGAKLSLAGPAGLSKTTVTGSDGSYTFASLPPGSYTVRASAPGLALRQPGKISVSAGVQTLNLILNVATEKQEVTVEEKSGPTVSAEAANNASAVVLSGSDLDALSDNPEDLAADLQALAGPPPIRWRLMSPSWARWHWISSRARNGHIAAPPVRKCSAESWRSYRESLTTNTCGRASSNRWA